MNENILIDIEAKKQTKKWRNISIFLVCLVILVLLVKLPSASFVNKSDSRIESIAEIYLNETIYEDEYRLKVINNLIKNDNIKAVLLHIDSPGGAVAPSETLFNVINKLNKKKPVISIMHGMATSGAYMVALGSDYIIAQNTSLTGSIGVLLQTYEITNLANAVGLEVKTFKSSKLKGLPSFFEKNTPEANKVLQSSIDDIYDYFVGLLKEKRPNLKGDNLKTAINGQAFTGRQALKIGLIDAIGDKTTALNYLKEKHNINIELPLVKVDLKKKLKFNNIQDFLGMFNLKSPSNVLDGNKKIMLIYQ